MSKNTRSQKPEEVDKVEEESSKVELAQKEERIRQLEAMLEQRQETDGAAALRPPGLNPP